MTFRLWPDSDARVVSSIFMVSSFIINMTPKDLPLPTQAHTCAALKSGSINMGEHEATEVTQN